MCVILVFAILVFHKRPIQTSDSNTYPTDKNINEINYSKLWNCNEEIQTCAKTSSILFKHEKNKQREHEEDISVIGESTKQTTITSAITTTETTTTTIIIIKETEIETAETEYEDTEVSDTQDYNAVYYTAYSGAIGYSGCILTSGYSVASNVFPQGTLLYIYDDYGYIPAGTYCVQDTGSDYRLSSNYIDFYYDNDEDVPTLFYDIGVVSIHVQVIE